MVIEKNNSLIGYLFVSYCPILIRNGMQQLEPSLAALEISSWFGEMGEVEEEDKQLLATAEASEIVRGETADSIGNEKDDLEQTRENGNNNDNIDTDEDDNPTTTTSTADTFSKSFQAVMSSIKSIIKGGEDGAPRNAAFVTFANLTSTNIARQTVHQHDPVACIPVEPPTPEFVK